MSQGRRILFSLPMMVLLVGSGALALGSLRLIAHDPLSDALGSSLLSLPPIALLLVLARARFA